MYQSQKSNFYHHFYSQFAVLIKNPRENVTFEWYGIVFRRWVLADSSKSGMYLNLWKRENITSDLLYHSNLGYRKWHQSSRKWSKNGKKIPENCHFSTLWPQSHLGHYFFQYFSLEKPSNWLLVDKKKFKKNSKIFKKTMKFWKKKIWTLVTGQKWLPEFCWMALVCCYDLIFEYQT